MQPKEDVTKTITKVDSEHSRTLDLLELLCSDFGIKNQLEFSPFVNALHGLASFAVFFLARNKDNHADTIAAKLSMQRDEFEEFVLRTIRNRLMSLQVDTFYETEGAIDTD